MIHALRAYSSAMVRMALGVSAAVMLAGCPIGDVLYATNVTSNGTDVVFAGQSSSGTVDYHLEYGLTTGYGSATPTRTRTVTANQWVTRQETISGLAADTVYHYRVCGKEHADTSWNCSGDHTVHTAVFSNPVSRCYGLTCALDVRIGDPIAFRDPNGLYYLTGSGPLSLFESADPSGGWVAVGDLAGDSNQPANMQSDPPSLPAGAQSVHWWGSELRRVGSYYIAVTSGNATASFQSGKGQRGAIFVGTIPTSQSLETAAVDWQPDPIVYSPDGTEQYYDPSVFEDTTTNKVWLVWTSWRNAPGSGENITRIYAIQITLSATGTPVTLAAGKTQSSRVQLLAATATAGNREQAFSNLWIVEGPGIIGANGNYWLYYAAGGEAFSNTGANFGNYSFNLSKPRTTFPGAFAKQTTAKLSTTPGTGMYRSPGHGGVLQDAGNNWWLVFHTRDSDNGFGRMVWTQQLYYDFVNTDFSMVQGGGTIQQDGNYAPTP